MAEGDDDAATASTASDGPAPGSPAPDSSAPENTTPEDTAPDSTEPASSSATVTAKGGRRTILIVALVAVVMAAGGFLAALLVLSPEDAAARAAPPPAGPITVSVERKRLDATVVTRGDIGFTGSTEVTLSSGGGAQIVTGRIPEVGSEVLAGTVLIEVTGRPVLALSGALPTYRTLTPGTSGPDVEQLEAALAGLGIDPGPQDKTYDAATGAAVAALYRNLGYEPPPASEEARAALAGAGQEVAAATQGQTEALDALTKAQAGPNRSERLTLQGSINSAQAALDEARVTPTAPDAAAVSSATAQLDASQADLQMALDALQTAVAAGASDVGPLQATFDQARERVGAAQQTLQEVSAGGPPSRAAIAAAQNQLDVAIATRDEAVDVDVTAQRAAMTQADARLAAAQVAQAAAQAASATPLPTQEVVWLAELPRRVDEVLVTRGSSIDKAFLRVSAADLSVRASVSAEEAGLLKVGMTAELTVPGSAAVPAVVTQVGGTAPAAATSEGSGTGGTPSGTPSGTPAGTPAGTSAGTTVILQPQNVTPDQARSLRGANVKVTIPVASTAGEVLVVPVAALFSDATGTPRVEILADDGTTRFQPTVLGLSARGEVEVRPIDPSGGALPAGPDTLEQGSLVVVGR